MSSNCLKKDVGNKPNNGPINRPQLGEKNSEVRRICTDYKSNPVGLVLEFEIWRLEVITNLISW